MKVILHNARQAYMTYFTPKSIKGSAPCFSGTFIVDGETTVSVPDMGLKNVVPEGLAKVCEKVIIDQYGKTSAKDKIWAFNRADGSTTRDKRVNDAGDYHDGFDAETLYVSTKKQPDQITKSECGQFEAGELYVVNQGKIRIKAQDGTIKPGDRVNVVVDFYAFDNEGTKGCTVSLEGVQLKTPGDALNLGGGRTNAADDFEEEEIPEGGDSAASMM